jgi:hypothetical protein
MQHVRASGGTSVPYQHVLYDVALQVVVCHHVPQKSPLHSTARCMTPGMMLTVHTTTCIFASTFHQPEHGNRDVGCPE